MTGTAIVRTLVQWGIAKILASSFGVALVTFLVTEFGYTPDPAVIANAVTGVLMLVVVYLVNTLGKKYAWINKLVSIGLSRTGPGYVPNSADAVVVKANPVGADTVTAVDTPPPGPNPDA